jgi:thiol-disulfide isomerase/thioredoxin
MEDSNMDNEVKEYLRPVRDSAGKSYSLWKAAVNGKWKGINIDSIYKSFHILGRRRDEMLFSYIRQHPDNYNALAEFEWSILNRRTLSLDTIIGVYNFFSQDVRESSKGKFIASLLEKKKSLSLSLVMPNFIFRDVNDSIYSLESFRGRNILICFWASWCGPCIRGIPKLKAFKEVYKDDLELISVSVENNKESWLKAVNKYQMPWLQTCDISGYTFESRIRDLYDIHYIPQYFLLNSEGKLIFHDYFEEEDNGYRKFQQELDKLLKR